MTDALLDVLAAGPSAGFATFHGEPVYFDRADRCRPGAPVAVYSLWRVYPDLVARWSRRPALAHELTDGLAALGEPTMFASATFGTGSAVTWQPIARPAGVMVRELPRIHVGLGLYEIAWEASRLRAHWELHRVRGGDLSDADLERLREMPADYLTLVRIAGWQWNDDPEGQLLWEPARVRPDPAQPYIVIGDYLQECWSYGLYVRGPHAGLAVKVPNENQPGAILGTLAEFVATLIADDIALYD